MSTTLVSCTVGQVEYALRAGDIVAVMRAERMRAPAAREAGIGVVTIGSDRVSVHALGTHIGADPASGRGARDRHVVVLRGSSGPVGWLVDRISRSHLAEGTRVLPLPALVGERARRWFGGVVDTTDRTMLLLSVAPVGASEGGEAIDGIQAFGPATDDVLRSPSGDTPLVVTFGSEALPSFGISRYAISARRVAGVESGLEITNVPGSAHPVIGITVWRSNVVPVLDFRQSRTPDEHSDQRLLILRCGGSGTRTAVALPVDAETALCQATTDNVLVDRARNGARAMPPFAVGVFDVRGQKVALLDPDALLRTAGGTEAVSESDGGACSTSGRPSTPWTSAFRNVQS